jgi:hypothetical protein
MNREEVEEAIQGELSQRKNRVVDRNALQALLGLVADPLGSLGKLFLGGQDALDNEKLRIQQDIILDFVCKIDDALFELEQRAKDERVGLTVVDGRIEAQGVDADEVIGLEVDSNAGMVELKPGTHIRASGTRTRSVTGLRIGGSERTEE